MIVRISIFDTIINLYKPYIMDNCIKIVSKIQFLTFCGGIKIKKELNLSDLALYLCCLGRTRTLTKGARNLRATITPQGIVSFHDVTWRQATRSVCLYYSNYRTNISCLVCHYRQDHCRRVRILLPWKDSNPH